MRRLVRLVALAVIAMVMSPIGAAEALDARDCLMQPVGRSGTFELQAGPFVYPGATSVEIGCELRAGAIDGIREFLLLSYSNSSVGIVRPHLTDFSLTPDVDYYLCTFSRAYPEGVRRVHSCAFAFRY